MLRTLKARPSSEKLAILRASADGLAADLENELVRLDRGYSLAIPIERIYNVLYLPAARAIADHLADVDDLKILRTPLSAELADTQLRVTLDVLYRFIAALSSL